MPSEFAIDQYLKELLKDAEGKLPKEKVEAFREVLAHESVAPRVKETVLMRSDYSRNMDRLREEEDALKKKISETESFYQSQILADHNNAEAFQKLQSELQRVKAALASGDASYTAQSSTSQPAGDFITKDDIEKRDQQMQKDALKLMARTNFLSMKHYKEFGEVLDVDQWYKHALDKGLPLDVAYDSYTADLRQKRVEEQHQAALAKAREEGAMEYASKHNLPLVDSHPHGVHALKMPEDAPKTPADRVRAATEAYLRREGQNP